MQKILISDFDETLYTSDVQLKNNVISINDFINNGNIFIIATGRTYDDINEMIKKYEIPFNYLICNDGGSIYDRLGNLIYKKDISLDVVQNIYQDLQKMNLSNITYFKTNTNYVDIMPKNTNAIIIKDINRENSIKILNFIENKYEQVHGYISDNWINIIDKSVSKSNGIKIISEINNYDKDNIFTIGDTINDIQMIKDYNGSCMINATDDLKSICNSTFNSVSEYIEYIEKI